jgi:hypothetical protein
MIGPARNSLIFGLTNFPTRSSAHWERFVILERVVILLRRVLACGIYYIPCSASKILEQLKLSVHRQFIVNLDIGVLGVIIY